MLRAARDYSICLKCGGTRTRSASGDNRRGSWRCDHCAKARRAAAKAEREEARRLRIEEAKRATDEARRAREAETELEKIAARIASVGVHNYYDPREVKRREWAELAQRARRA
jgi:hypothetical protein